MHVDRQVLGLFFEIKRNLPLSTCSKLKISDCNIAKKLVILHNHNNDVHLKSLIEMFLQHIDGNWIKHISPLSQQSSSENSIKEKICAKILHNKIS